MIRSKSGLKSLRKKFYKWKLGYEFWTIKFGGSIIGGSILGRDVCTFRGGGDRSQEMALGEVRWWLRSGRRRSLEEDRRFRSFRMIFLEEVMWPLGGTCIPRNKFEDHEVGFLWPATHFRMCFSRVLATLNGISQKRHLKMSLPILRCVFMWRVSLELCAQE